MPNIIFLSLMPETIVVERAIVPPWARVYTLSSDGLVPIESGSIVVEPYTNDSEALFQTEESLTWGRLQCSLVSGGIPSCWEDVCSIIDSVQNQWTDPTTVIVVAPQELGPILMLERTEFLYGTPIFDGGVVTGFIKPVPCTNQLAMSTLIEEVKAEAAFTKFRNDPFLQNPRPQLKRALQSLVEKESSPIPVVRDEVERTERISLPIESHLL